MTIKFIAHERSSDHVEQSVLEHLLGVGARARGFAGKIGASGLGELIGLLHDLGKYSSEFQNYLKSAIGMLTPDADDFVDAVGLKGKVDHSTAGAQFIWNRLRDRGPLERFVGQVAAICIASHHSGLIDAISPDGSCNFIRRANKDDFKTHFNEVVVKADERVTERAVYLIDKEVVSEICGLVTKILRLDRFGKGQDPLCETIPSFKVGLLVRFLFSCLIDADRLDTADFETPKAAKLRHNGAYSDWKILSQRLEEYLYKLPADSPVNQVRREIADSCAARAADPKGIFTLTVPTGGGKTLASLRFATRHAAKHSLDRVIYVLPYTSIIDQNAAVARKVFEGEDQSLAGRVVLEHHSNILPAQETWRTKILAENWDAPIVFTTMVQFLEALFSGGTRGARRMHQLANSVIVFDEIQTLPVRCVRLFCNSLNFLIENCNSSAVLCTATQPLLDKLENPEKGVLKLQRDSEIIADVPALFSKLKRVEVVDRTRPEGWALADLAKFVIDEQSKSGSCLIVVNTKAVAQSLYSELSKMGVNSVYHLSTSMCPAHRLSTVEMIKKSLGKSPVICVSTQLIEAGVDLDFGTVFRSVAGLDSIAQAAGRCNRNGLRDIGYTYVVNPLGEKISGLPDISIGREKTLRIFSEIDDDNKSAVDLLSPQLMRRYFDYYFYARTQDMDYQVSGKLDRDDTLLNLLSYNPSVSFTEQEFFPALRQSFSTAGDLFSAIDAPSRGVIVPYGEGRQIIAELASSFDLEKDFTLLKRAQRFTVNLFPNVLDKLSKAGALHPVQKDSEILALFEQYYHPDLGVCSEPVTSMEPQVI